MGCNERDTGFVATAYHAAFPVTLFRQHRTLSLDGQLDIDNGMLDAKGRGISLAKRGPQSRSDAGSGAQDTPFLYKI